MTIKHLGGIFGRNPTFNDVTIDGGIYIGGNTSSNLLDDYEEGTWTPEISAATPGDLAVTYSSQIGEYTKIGRLVNVYASITTSAFTHSTASGIARITGLPFAVTQRGVGSLSFEGISKGTYSQFTILPNAGTSYLQMNASKSATSTSTVKITEMPSAGTVSLQFTATYIV